MKINKANAILGEMLNFYEELYTSKNIRNENIESYLSEINEIPKYKLDNDDAQLLEFFPSYEECKEAVNNMKKEKSPGLDGLPSEFYQCFWDDIGPFLYKAIKDSYHKGELSYSQRLSVISLIHKKVTKIDYRPISLTISDYKIIAFVLAKRLHNLPFKLINTNQTAYIKGRYIGENARLILDVFEYCERENIDGLLLF